MSAETEFKRRFVAAFLGGWVANNYADACTRGQQYRLSDPPVEDAKELADDAWKCWKRNGGESW